ncbi:MAG: nuclear transport factor 2 family protein [Steroidobacteraceae bacterium]
MNKAIVAAAALSLLSMVAVAPQASAEAQQHAEKAAADKPFSFKPSLPLQTDAQRKSAPGDKSPKAVVNAFNQLGFIEHRPVEAMKKYLSPNFIERSPDFAVPGFDNDKEAAIDFFSKRGWKPEEQAKDDIYMVISEGQIVMVYHHVTYKPGTAGFAYVDIFRVEDGLIVEHWTVGQPMPTNVTPKHSMF